MFYILAQIVMLVLWYTVAPALPWFIVFLPLLVWAFVWVCILAGIVAASFYYTVRSSSRRRPF